MKRAIYLALLAAVLVGSSGTSVSAGEGKSNNRKSAGSSHKYRGFYGAFPRGHVNQWNRNYRPTNNFGWNRNHSTYRAQPYWGHQYKSRYRNQWGHGNFRAPATRSPYYKRYR